jgi:hypothetical protein
LFLFLQTRLARRGPKSHPLPAKNLQMNHECPLLTAATEVSPDLHTGGQTRVAVFRSRFLIQELSDELTSSRNGPEVVAYLAPTRHPFDPDAPRSENPHGSVPHGDGSAPTKHPIAA